MTNVHYIQPKIDKRGKMNNSESWKIHIFDVQMLILSELLTKCHHFLLKWIHQIKVSISVKFCENPLSSFTATRLNRSLELQNPCEPTVSACATHFCDNRWRLTMVFGQLQPEGWGYCHNFCSTSYLGLTSYETTGYEK